MRKGTPKNPARIVVDVLMAIMFVLVMATAMVAEAPHEFLGLALIALMVAHVVLNRRWFTSLVRGRWTPLRVLQTLMVLGLVVCIIGQAASALVLSKHAFGFLPAIPGAATARTVHMLCSHWSFVFAFAHAGLQLKSMMAKMGKKVSASPAITWAVRIAVVAIAAFGAYSFVQLSLPLYLTGQVHFAAGQQNMLLGCAQWASVAVLISALFHVLRTAIGKK